MKQARQVPPGSGCSNSVISPLGELHVPRKGVLTHGMAFLFFFLEIAMHCTTQDVSQALQEISKFLPQGQLQVLRNNTRGEEGDFFIEKIAEVAEIIRTMPATYQQDGKGDTAVAHLHYFIGGCDWWITEKDMEGGTPQAFGLASLNGGEPELGYISIDELVLLAVELDLYWTPRTLAEIRQAYERKTGASSPVSVVPDIVSPQGDQVISLSQFVADFGDSLLQAVQVQNPPIYDGAISLSRRKMMQGLFRKPFEAQADVVQAVARLLIDEAQPASIINAEMGTGKTIMGIATAAVLHAEGFPRALVISPPHLVYKWRREIKETVPDARVWILNGPDTLRKLMKIRSLRERPTVPEFFILGRVRMRMGFNWKPAFITRSVLLENELGTQRASYAACPRCGAFICDEDGAPMPDFQAVSQLNDKRKACSSCGEQLWTLVAGSNGAKSRRDLLADSIRQIPTIGEKTAERLLSSFGEDMLSGMLEDNVYEFINLMNEEGDLFFSDRQANRMERAMAKMEFAFGQGGYQATEFIKRYLPHGYFGLLIVDEGHEYKNDGSAQGQAMGVLARKCRKTLMLTGTLMGGYADDLFFLLWRLHPKMMMEDGFRYNARGSLGSAAMAFMREHGVIKDIYKETEGRSHPPASG